MYLYVVEIQNQYWVVFAKDDGEMRKLIRENKYTEGVSEVRIVEKTQKPRVLNRLPYGMKHLP